MTTPPIRLFLVATVKLSEGLCCYDLGDRGGI